MPFRLFYILILLLCLQFPSFGQETPILFSPVKNLPYFESPEVSIDSAEYNTLVLRAKAKQKGTARFFWASSYDPQFNQPKSVWFSIKSGEHNYYINVPSQNPYWIGWIKKFIVYPETGLEIQSAKIIRGNLFTHLASGWQEFFGPRGRLVIGSTINVIPSSSIFGQSVNIYAYWLTGAFFIIYLTLIFLKNIGKSKNYYINLNSSLSRSISHTLIFALSLWALLALNSNYNFLEIFKVNHSKYFGKSIEDKRAVAYGKEYHAFLKFAKERLPARPVKYAHLTSKYLGGFIARMYLYPHAELEISDRDLEYVLVFHPAPDQSFDNNMFIPFAQLRENEYILKRK